MLLLSMMTLLCGCLGLPPVNGVIPQSPMLTRSLALVVNPDDDVRGRGPGGKADDGSTGTPSPKVSVESTGHDCGDGGVRDGGSGETRREVVKIQVVETRGANLFQSLLIGACLGLTPAIRWIPTSLLWAYFAFMYVLSIVLFRLSVRELFWVHRIPSPYLSIPVITLTHSPTLHSIVRSSDHSFIRRSWIRAFESLPGSQLWERTLLLLTDPRRRYKVYSKPHVAFLETVPFGMIARFTILQLVIVGGIYGTWYFRS